MKKAIYFLIIIILFSSCRKEDPVPEVTPAMARDSLYYLMKEWYYWYDRMPSVNLENYADPYELLEALRYRPLDRWSYVDDYNATVSQLQGSLVGHGIRIGLDESGIDDGGADPDLAQTVGGVEEAVEHVNSHGSHHTDAIVAEAVAEELAAEGAQAIFSLEDLSQVLPTPRVVWVMLPAGTAVDDTLRRMKEILEPGDIIVEGGNTFYKDDLRRAAILEEKNIRLVDVGVSGGVWGLEKGYCLMIGGQEEACQYLEPLFKTLTPKDGFLRCGPTGAGHFVKMIHNGIEYGLMQAYAEGFQLLETSAYGEKLDLAGVAHLWNQGSVIRSWLLELAEDIFAKNGKLDQIKGVVEDTGEGRWTVNQAIESGVSAPVITMALMNRFRSREDNPFPDRLLAALRQSFGGHPLKK